MILKLDKLTVEVVRALEKFLGSKENRTTIAKWEYHSDIVDGKYTNERRTFEEESGTTRLVEVLEPIAFDQKTGFFRVALEVHETATSGHMREHDDRMNMRMLTLRTPFLHLLAVLGLFPEPPVEKRVEISGAPSYNDYVLPAPIPLLAKPKEEKPAAPTQS